MEFIDLHIHLQDYEANFATDIVKKAQKFGLKKMVCAATCLDDWQKVADFAQKYPDLVVPAFGVHPWHVADISADWSEQLKQYLNDFPSALIGETGLDGLKPEFELQQKFFSAHLELAQKYNRPIIIHSVKAVAELNKFWSQMPPKFMIHSFNGKTEHLREILAHNGYVSFSASILKNREMKNIIRTVPLNRLLLESDGPYQAFEKGAISSPFFIVEMLHRFALVLNLKVEDLSQQIYNNSLEFTNVG